MGILSEMWVVFGAKTDKLKAGTKEAEQTLGKFGQSVNKIGGMIAAAFAVEKIASFAWEATKLAGEMQGVKYAFDQLNKPGLLQNLRNATQGTVSDLELMKSAVQANNFQIPLEQLGSLLKFAHLRAQQTGQSVDYLVQSIVLGIGRKSPLILDNLGISAVALREKFKGIAAEEQTVGDIAQAVGEIAEEAIAKSGAAIETTKSKIERMNAQWQNTKTIIGELLTPAVSVLVGLLNDAAAGWQHILRPGAMAKSFSSTEIENFKKQLQGLSNDDAIKAVQQRLSEINAQKKQLASEKYPIFSKDLKNAQVLMGHYEIVSTWLKQLFYDTDQLTSIIEAKNAVTEDGTKLTEDEIAKQKELARIERERLQYIQGKFLRTPGTMNPSKQQRDVFSYDPKLKGAQTAGPDIEGFTEITEANAKRMQDALDATTESAQRMSDMVINAFSDVSSFKSFANAVKNAAKQAILAYIAEATAANIAKAVKSGKTWYGALIQGALAAAGTSAVFNAVPSFSKGGMVNGPTLAMVGDNPSGKEYMLPQELINKLGGGQRITGELKLRGHDLYFSLRNYEKHLTRVS